MTEKLRNAANGHELTEYGSRTYKVIKIHSSLKDESANIGPSQNKKLFFFPLWTPPGTDANGILDMEL